MDLYQLPYSHFSAKVRIVALEKNIILNFPELPQGEQKDEYLKINSTGLVPCLVDDQLVLGESEVIVEYLNDQYPSPQMLPSDVSERAFSRWLSRVHDLYVAPTLTRIFQCTLASPLDSDTAAEEIEKLNNWLTIVEEKINPQPYFCGERFCISDASYCLSFWYAIGLCQQFDMPLDQERFPKLFAWFEQVSGRSSFVSVLTTCKQALGIDADEEAA